MSVRWHVHYRRADGSLGECLEDVDVYVTVMRLYDRLRGRVARLIHEDDFVITSISMVLEF